MTIERLASICLVFSASLFLHSAPGAELVRRIRVPQGGVQPQAVADKREVLHLIYMAGDPGGSDIYYVTRQGEGPFSIPIRVNSIGGTAIALGTVRGAQIALGKNGRLHVGWNGSLQADGKSSGEGFFYTRFTNGSFEPQRNLMRNSTHLDGGGSLAADASGNVFVFWHGFPAGAIAQETNRAVFMAKSSDDGETFLPDEPLKIPHHGACGCCGLSALSLGVGKIAVLYRTADASGNRDVMFLTSLDSGSTFRERIMGPWQVNACPLSTMAMAQEQSSLVAAWETKGKIWSAAGSPEFPAEPQTQMLNTGNQIQKHPAIAVGKGRTLFVWAEGTGWGRGGGVVWCCRDKKGVVVGTGKESGLPVWSKPAAVSQPDGTFLLIF